MCSSAPNGAPIAEHLRALIDEMQGEFGYRLLGVDISVDHVHLLLEIPPEKSVCIKDASEIRVPSPSTLRSVIRDPSPLGLGTWDLGLETWDLRLGAAIRVPGVSKKTANSTPCDGKLPISV